MRTGDRAGVEGEGAVTVVAGPGGDVARDGDGRERFRTLPEPVRLADTVEGHDPEPPPDPTMGRDPERDFLLRNAG
ncbi:hypothetical protein [Kineococcus glutinatus]|uniref:Uncharacterized protein n=1 Tax=Kineococcus glutinatus TaxID=1070872 RepID=A0ABP8VL06_9ACTN